MNNFSKFPQQICWLQIDLASLYVYYDNHFVMLRGDTTFPAHFSFLRLSKLPLNQSVSVEQKIEANLLFQKTFKFILHNSEYTEKIIVYPAMKEKKMLWGLAIRISQIL